MKAIAESVAGRELTLQLNTVYQWLVAYDRIEPIEYMIIMTVRNNAEAANLDAQQRDLVDTIDMQLDRDAAHIIMLLDADGINWPPGHWYLTWRANHID